MGDEMEKLSIRKDWKKIAKRAWSFRIAAFWAAVSGLWVLWPALEETIPAKYYIAFGLVMAIAVVIARITKQPGADL